MTDYKNTLNLPHTDFPMRANLAQREPGFLQHWQDIDLNARLNKAGDKTQKRFILHDGPPYANGNIHIGHAVNKVLKDIILKAKRQEGFFAPFQPGWDCHGLPIEQMVEKKKGKVGKKLNAAEFRLACREYAQKQVDQQKSDFIRLGILADWQNPYLTMNPATEAGIVRALGEIIAQGHVQMGYKPVHWCLDCQSSLAEAEVEYKDISSPSIDVAFVVQDDTALKQAFACEYANIPTQLIIWTTTPWTLPANQAVCLHPELDYVLIRCQQHDQAWQLIVADALLEKTCQRCQLENIQTLGHCSGSVLEGLLLQHPFQDRQVPIILGTHITTEQGTGAVHTAPAHGQEDHAVGKRYQLPEQCPVDDRGCFIDSTPDLAGVHVRKANPLVLDLLRKNGTLLYADHVEHSYPHCWRHKSPLIFRATAQWFISMQQQGLRQQALATLDQVQWLPEWGINRIHGMLEGRPDWCISRQRHWGVPIPLFIHRQNGQLHPDTPALIERVAHAIEQHGMEAWFGSKVSDWLDEEADDYQMSRDILDVWFDSGVSHHAVLPAAYRPADLYLEGSDQHRGWFQSSLLSALAMEGKPPYRAVMTHGFTVDAQGRKMSKSQGNVVAPQQIIQKLGADILRLWIAATDTRGEMSVSDEILKRTADGYRRIRNTLRFLLANLHGFEPATDLLPSQQLLSLDRWMLNHAERLQNELREDYAQYHFHQVYQRLLTFCSEDLGGFYLDIIKDRQYTTQSNSRARRSAQTVLFHLAEAMCRWIAPILSFTAEEIWQHLPGTRSADSVHLSTWYVFPETSGNAVDHCWPALMEARKWLGPELEALRKQGHIGSSLDTEIDLYASKPLLQTLNLIRDELRFVMLSSEVRLMPLSDAPEQAIQHDFSGTDNQAKAMLHVSQHHKCSRCWHKRADVGQHPEHPQLCGRCISNVCGTGEQRSHA